MDETLYDECYIASVDGVHHYLIISDYGESADFTSMIFEYGNGEMVKSLMWERFWHMQDG